MADQPARAKTHDPGSEFWTMAERTQVDASRFPRAARPQPDRSHPAMAVNLDACIQLQPVASARAAKYKLTT